MLVVSLLHLTPASAETADGTNLAPLTPYAITPPPNYALATGTPGTVLTDGRRAGTRFWVGGDSIGWSWQSPIVYRQPLVAGAVIRRVEIGTGQNLRSDIAAPASAFVYARAADGGRAKDGWVYLGDAAAATSTTDDGPRTLALDFPGLAATAIEIVVYRGSPYVFLDEVRVVAAAAAQPDTPREAVGDIATDPAIRRRATAAGRARLDLGAAPLGDDSAARFAWPLPAVVAGATAAGCTATRIASWTESTPTDLAAAPAATGAALNATGGWLTMAVRLENHGDQPQPVMLAPGSVRGTGPPETFAANYVLALDHRWRADVLTPTQDLALPPSSMALVMVRARVLDPGAISATLHVTCGAHRSDITVDGRAVAITAPDRPYANTWSYLEGPARHLQRCGTRVLDDAWIDTAVVNATALGPRRTAANNDELRAYLRTFAHARRLLLFMDLTDAAWSPDTGAMLNRQLAGWWRAVSTILAQEAYRGEVLLYPIDEVAPAQLPRHAAAVHMLRLIAPGVPIFATIENVAAAAAASADVKQFEDRILTKITPAQYGAAPLLYATAEYAKTAGLSDYYRRLGWLAFGAGMKGAGLWSLWDANGADHPELGWTDFGGTERDFNLVYAGHDGCPLPSRRLWAFQRGLEDFALMTACQRQTSPAAKSLPATKSSPAEALQAAAQAAAQSLHWTGAMTRLLPPASAAPTLTGLFGGAAPVRPDPHPDFDAALARLGPQCGAIWQSEP